MLMIVKWLYRLKTNKQKNNSKEKPLRSIKNTLNLKGTIGHELEVPQEKDIQRYIKEKVQIKGYKMALKLYHAQ